MWTEWLSLLDAPEERLFWPYLVSALVIALVAALFGRVSLSKELFTRALWWHPSARADYGLFVVRALISLLLIAPLLVSSTVVARWSPKRVASEAMKRSAVYVRVVPSALSGHSGGAPKALEQSSTTFTATTVEDTSRGAINSSEISARTTKSP